MPILLKDNINTANMPTTAGAALLADHMPPANAFIVDQLSARGALILGKVNLSEWAYFFCEDCPRVQRSGRPNPQSIRPGRV